MNMKKTIAALSAAAVAVSAMATTVSAEETTNGGSFKYNLVKETEVKSGNTAEITARGVADADAGDDIQIALYSTDLTAGTIDYTVFVKQQTGNNFKTFVLNHNKDNADYPNYANMVVTSEIDPNPQYNPDGQDLEIIKIPVSALGDMTGTVEVTVVAKGATKTTTQAELNESLLWNTTDGDSTIFYIATTRDPSQDVKGVFTSTADKVKKPIMTNLKGVNNDGVTDVIRYLHDTMGYVNVLPVLNDVIANYDNVTFTFTSCQSHVKDGVIVEKDGWFNPTFGQHLYNEQYYNKEGSGFVATPGVWATNLFAGGLVINNGYTMALNQTDIFEYGANTLSFDWDSLTGGKVTNAASLLASMQLITANEWYWESMDVTFSNDAAEEDASAGAGTDSEELDETPVEDEAAEEVVEDEPAEESPAEESPAEKNPATGNASVALAVIPVALAAAAIVAKKRS